MAISTPLFGAGRARQRAAAAAYSGLLRAALAPSLYAGFGIPDTFAGRAQAVTLTTALVCHRLAGEPVRAAKPLIGLINARVLDGFDAAFREQGVGDASIARKVRKLAESHSGLGRAVLEALQGGSAAELADVLVRNGVIAPDRGAALAGALILVRDAFASQPGEEVLAGAFDWSPLTREDHQGLSNTPVALGNGAA